jgi:hypothetical protein
MTALGRELSEVLVSEFAPPPQAAIKMEKTDKNKQFSPRSFNPFVFIFVVAVLNHLRLQFFFSR